MISGILASPGIAFGTALLLKEEKIVINRNTINIQNIEIEIQKFFEGKRKSIEQLTEIKIKTREKFGAKKESIFEGHIMLLQDEELENEIISIIKKRKKCAAAATELIIEGQAKNFRKT